MTESTLVQMTMRGKWAEGIEPRHFVWIVKDSLAVSERPGGYGSQHRRVRRMEEIIWIRQHDFDWVVSLIDSSHNLHNYDEYDVSYLHRPIVVPELTTESLDAMYRELNGLLEGGNKVLVHHEELGDKLCGYLAGYLVWSGLVEAPPTAINVIEQITERQLGPLGREIVTITAELAGA